MKKYFEKLPKKFKKIIRLIRLVSEETGMPAYLVGGCLRDLVLQVKNFDLDITVEGGGIVFAQRLAKKLKSELMIHERFGTATLILNDLAKVDIATTRKEEYPSCASLPVISCGTLKEDLRRRDFTINAMAASLVEGGDQKLIDPFNGQNDLRSGRIRILHDLSFRDDPTRILRAIRFEQRFNFKIEPETLFLIKQSVKNKGLNKVSPQRIRDELILMLKEQDPLKQVRRLNNLCALSFINKKLKSGKTTYDLFKSIDREISWFAKNFPAYKQLNTWLIYFTALISPLALKEIKKTIIRLGLRREERKMVISYCQLRQKLSRSLSKKGVLPAQIFIKLKPLSYEAIILLKSASKDKYLKKHITDFLKVYNGMRLYARGKDLAGLGVLPGPGYKRIFSEVLAAKLNGQVKNFRDELNLIKKIIVK